MNDFLGVLAEGIKDENTKIAARLPTQDILRK